MGLIPNLTSKLYYVQQEGNPFEQNRISGSLNLVNWNGTATFELRNLQYNDDGVFYLECVRTDERLGIAVEVQSKFFD